MIKKRRKRKSTAFCEYTDQLEQKIPWHIAFLHHPLTTKGIYSSTVQSESE